MAGIYIHIPFCAQACSYCDFHFSVNTNYKSEMVQAIIQEIELRKDAVKHLNFKTLYFGGGTPSVLSHAEIKQIITSLEKHYQLDIEEFTFEANPEHLSLNYIQELKALGVNRISLGTQSFINNELEEMRRQHKAEDIPNIIQNLKNHGITNISLDLIFGWPGSDLKSLEYSLNQIIQMDVTHLSAYSLGIENKTILEQQIDQGKLKEVTEEAYLDQFLFIRAYLQKYSDLRPYELSNFAKKGFESKHNSNYWNLNEYIGFGPSAHSYIAQKRSYNIAKNRVYIKSLLENKIPHFYDETSLKQQFNEYIMIRLRTSIGLNWRASAKHFPSDWIDLLKNKAQTLANNQNDIIVDNEGVRLQDKALYLSDHIILELFQE